LATATEAQVLELPFHHKAAPPLFFTNLYPREVISLSADEPRAPIKSLNPEGVCAVAGATPTNDMETRAKVNTDETIFFILTSTIENAPFIEVLAAPNSHKPQQLVSS
jgi:hypothetical protein